MVNCHEIYYCVILLQASHYTLKCLSIGTPKIINFPFVSNGKLMFLGVPIFKHIMLNFGTPENNEFLFGTIGKFIIFRCPIT